jgi:hypothetical protein
MFTQENADEVTSGGQSDGSSGVNGNVFLHACYLFRSFYSFMSGNVARMQFNTLERCLHEVKLSL